MVRSRWYFAVLVVGLAVAVGWSVKAEAKRFTKKKRRIVSIVVKDGDSLWRLAKRHRCSVKRLQRLNKITGSAIYSGQRLRVPTRKPRTLFRAFRPIRGQSVGGPRSGRLRRGVRLPPGQGYHLRRPYRAWGASHTVFYVRQAIAAVRRKFPKIHRLAIGDLSAKHGGRLGGHKSHQSGRDVDLGLYFKRRPRYYPKSFIKAQPQKLHFAATWTLIKALLASSNKPGGVQRIYMNYNVQRMFYSWARKRGISRRQLGRVFQYPRGRHASGAVVRHWRGHDAHIHVRFKCPVGDDNCYL